jgi:hypothetical protein
MIAVTQEVDLITSHSDLGQQQPYGFFSCM